MEIIYQTDHIIILTTWQPVIDFFLLFTRFTRTRATTVNLKSLFFLDPETNLNCLSPRHGVNARALPLGYMSGYNKTNASVT